MIEVQIRWGVNPFRGDRFAAGWLSAAEAALDFGATRWSLTRSLEGRLDFIQTAQFPSKAHWERYWYSEEIAEKRVELAGYYQVPILPTLWEVVGTGDSVDPRPNPARAAPS